MLHEGRMQLEGAKKTIEGVQADLKAIKGIWDWVLGLFVSKPAKPAKTEPVAKAKAPKKDESYEALELETIKNVGIQLGNFFDIQAQLTNYYASLEAESKERYDPIQSWASARALQL